MEVKLKDEICKLFPPGSNVVHVEGDSQNFTCHIKLCIVKREEFAEWLDHHSLLSGVKYVMVKTIKEKGYIYNAIYGCRQNKRKPKSSDCTTSCKSTLRVMIKKSDQSSKGKTLLRPTTVSLSYCHNHDIFGSEEAKPSVIDECAFHDTLRKLFPPNTNIVFAVRYGTEKEFVCRLKVEVESKEDFNNWLDEHSMLSYVTYRVKKTEAKDKSLYNAYYRCHHNTFPRKDSKPHRKHTNCNATLHVVIKEKSDNRGTYVAKITLNHIHNHDIMASAALVHRDPSHETREKFLSLFKHGVGPAQALHIHHADLKEEYDKDYNNIMYDRHICPDRQWVYRLYYSVYDEKQRSSHFQATVDYLNVQIFNLNSGGETCAEMKVTDDKEIVIAICSQLMKRMHLLKSAGDTVYVDSTGNSDRYHFKVMVLMCNSAVGGLPLGVLLMTSEKEATISAALSLLVKMLPNEAFCGRGKLGPVLFMTDDTTAQRASLKHVFPEAKYLPCPYRMVQAAWKWIMNKRSDIHSSDKVPVFELITSLLTSMSKEEFEKQFLCCLKDELGKRYPSFIKYIEELGHHNKDRLDEYFTLNCEHHEHYQRSILESAIHVLKDSVFKRMKSYDLQQSYEFFSVGFSNYYARKLLEAVGGNSDLFSQSEYLVNFPTDDLEVVKISDVEFNVVDKRIQIEHTVRGDFWLCDCFIGVCCNPCKHQHAIWQSFPGEEVNSNFLEMKTKQDLYHIATGIVGEDGEWYGSMTYDIPQEGVVLILTNDEIEVFQPNENDDALMETNVEEQVPLDEDNFWTEMNKFSDKLLPFFRNNPKKMMEAWKKFSEKVNDITTEPELLKFFESCEC